MRKLLLAAGVAVLGLAAAGTANAGYVYVGSWQVDQGPGWGPAAIAYTGQEAAALLFGGSPADYVISTVDQNPADINFETWVSTWGGACGGTYPCGTVIADNSVISTNGHYLNRGDQSAYVHDWAIGSQYTNFAFLGSGTAAAVPEPASLAIMGLGLAGFALVRRRPRE